MIARRLAGMAGVAFGWAPDVFWRATPAELGALVGAVAGGGGEPAPADRATLARLQEIYPDG